MRIAATMLLRGLLHRWWLSCGIVALTLAAVVAAAIGPIYLNSSMTSLRVDRLDQQSNTNKSMTWAFMPAGATSWDEIRTDAADAVRERVDRAYYTPPQVTWVSPIVKGIDDRLQFRWNMEARESDCAHLDVVRGHCPRRRGEMMVAAIDVERGGFRIGSTVDLDLGHPMRVVGSYRLDDPDSTYWFDPIRYVSTPQQGSPGSSGYIPYAPAPFLVVPDEVGALPAAARTVRVDRVLQVPSDIEQGTLDRLADTARGEAKREPVDVDGGRLGPADATQLGAIRDDVEAETAIATRTILPASLSLILVCVILQFRLISAAAELRRPEIALLKVRGWGGRKLRAITLAEPLALLLIGGIGGALLVLPFGSRLTSMWLRGGTPTVFSVGAAAMVVLVLAASGAATVLATRAVAGESLRRQLEPASAPPEPRRTIRVLRILVVVAAVVAVAVAMVGDPSAPSLIGQSMPAVVGLATAIVATASTLWVARRVLARTARRASTVRFLQARGIVRRRDGAMLVLPVTVALTVSAFAIGVWSTAEQWRESAAAAEVGADRSYEAPMNPIAAKTLTHELDPDGRWLMATAYDVLADDVRILVDSPRLPSVAQWPDSWTGPGTIDSVAGNLSPAPAPRIGDGELAIEATSKIHSGERLYLTLSLLAADGGPRTISVGPFPEGTHVRSAVVSGCVDGCAVTRMQIGGVAGVLTPLDGSFTVGSVSLDGEHQTLFVHDDAVRWEASADIPADPDIEIDTARGGIELTIDTRGAKSSMMLEPRGTPFPVPVVAGRDAPTLGVGADSAVSGRESATAIPIERVRIAEALPVVGSFGVMADLTEMVRARPQAWDAASVRILATDDTPDSVVSALERAGVDTSDPILLADVRADYDNEAYALSLRLYVLAAVATLTLAVIGVVVSLAVQVRSRRADAAALRVTGVRERAVWRAAVLELGTVIGVATLLGTAAGAGAAQIVVRGTRLGTVDVGTPRVLTEIDPGALAILCVGVLGILSVVSALIARTVVRSGRPSALRSDA